MTSEKKVWSKEEILFLKEKRNLLSTGEIAVKLGRTRYGVYQKMKSLGLYISDKERKKQEGS